MPNNGKQLLARTILNDGDKNLRAALVQTQHGRFAARSPSSLAAPAPGAEVAFVDLDLARERPQFFQSQRDDAFTPKGEKPMHGEIYGVATRFQTLRIIISATPVAGRGELKLEQP